MENWIHLQRRDIQQMGPNASTPNTRYKLCLKQAPRKRRQILPDMVSLYGEFLEFQPLLFLHHDTGKRKGGGKKLHRRKTLSSRDFQPPIGFQTKLK